jgi:hypothetical protein
VWEQVLRRNKRTCEFKNVVSVPAVLSLVIWWNTPVRHGPKPTLLMNPHILSHVPATSPGRSSEGFPGMGAPKDAKNVRHSDASESRVSEI